jgi:hypothetical protein
LDAALLAHEHDALLYADDAILREAAKIHPGVEGVGTQSILESLCRREQLTKEAYYEALEKLSEANYRYLLLNADFFVWLLNKHENAVNKAVRAAFRYLEGPMCDEDAAVVITAFSIKTVWTSRLKYERRFDVLDWCLLSLTTGRSINSMVDKLQRMLFHPQLGLRDKRDSLREIFLFIEQWRILIMGSADA